MRLIRWSILVLALAGCGEAVDDHRGVQAPDDRTARLEQRYRHGGEGTFAVTAWELVALADSLAGPAPVEAARLARNVFLSSAPAEARYEAFRIMVSADPGGSRHRLELVVRGRQDADYLPRLRPVLPDAEAVDEDPLVVTAYRRFQRLDPLARISWLAGAWERRDGDLRVVEEWFPAVGGEMHGISRSWRGGEPAGWERLRIGADGEELLYTALPSGQAATTFRGLPRLGTVIFANREHDFPEALHYLHTRPDGDLEVVAQGTIGGERRTMTWTYRRLHGPEMR